MAKTSRNGAEQPDTGDPKTLPPEKSADLSSERTPGIDKTETLPPEESATAPSAKDGETLRPEESTNEGLPPASDGKPIDVVRHQAERRFGNPDELSQEVVKAFNEGYLKLADAIESYTHGLEFAARYFEAVGGTMSAWQEEIYDKRNLVRTPQATNDFQPYVKWAHGDNPDASGMISRLAYALDVWAEYPDGKRPSPVVNEGETESAFITWLNSHGGYHGLYSGRGESRGRYVDPGDFTVYKLQITGATPDETHFRVYLTGGEDLGAFEDHYPEAIAEVARELPEFAGQTPTIDHPASPTASTPPPRRTAAAPTGRGRGRPAGQWSRGGGSTTPKGKHSRVVNAVNLLGQTKDLAQIIIGDASKHALEQAEKAMLFFREVADEIEIELNKIDEKVARAEARKGSRRKAA